MTRPTTKTFLHQVIDQILPQRRPLQPEDTSVERVGFPFEKGRQLNTKILRFAIFICIRGDI